MDFNEIKTTAGALIELLDNNSLIGVVIESLELDNFTSKLWLTDIDVGRYIEGCICGNFFHIENPDNFTPSELDESNG